MSLKVMKASCSTCPFTDKGWVEVRDLLTDRAMLIATPICHSTGKQHLSKKRISRRQLACRGARNLQLEMFYACGFLKEPTDEAWEEKVRELK